MKHLIAIVVLLTSAPTIASAQGRIVYGAGLISCAEWTKYRSANDKPNSYQLQAYIDGYLSGYNAASSDVDYLLTKQSSVAFYAWIDIYCAAHPLDPLIKAITELQDELRARAK